MKSILLASALAVLATPAFASSLLGDSQGQGQGQLQGQGQSQSQTSLSLSSSSAASASVSGSRSSATGGTADVRLSGNNASQSVGGQQSTNSVTENYQRNPVATAFSSQLSFSSDTCYASAAAGGQGIGFGLSTALPFKDKQCERRANARMLEVLGEREAAIQYLAAGDWEINSAITRARAAHH